MKRVLIVGIAAAVALSFAGMAQAQTEGAMAKPRTKADTLKWAEAHFKYVGEKSCKMCHKAEFESWALTKHAKAWESLKPEDQKKAECVSCHSVGKTAADSLLTGVGCESCHGPGSEYKSNTKMKDHALAVAAGVLPVTEATCTGCHNKNSPTFKAFDFAKAKETGVHKMKAKETTQ